MPVPNRLISLRKTTSSSSLWSGSHEIISATISPSISGRGIQNKSSGLISEKEGEDGELWGEGDGHGSSERELGIRLKIDANAFAIDLNASSFNGPSTFLVKSDSSRQLREEHWTGSESIDVRSFAMLSLASARLSVLPTKIGVGFESPAVTSTIVPVPEDNSKEIERLRSILADKLMLTEGDAAILNDKLKENKQEPEKVLCSNSILKIEIFLTNMLPFNKISNQRDFHLPNFHSFHPPIVT